MKKMKKNLTGAIAIFLFLFPLSAFAQTLQPGFYACNGSAYSMSVAIFGKSGLATIYLNDAYLCNATISISDITIAFTFGTGPDQYRGKTWVYKLINDNSFDGNGEHWIKVGDSRSPTGKSIRPSTGSITNPDQGLRFSDNTYAPGRPQGYVSSGIYSLWGSRYKIYLIVNGTIGYGSFMDDYDNNLGDFRVYVNGDALSITFVNSKRSGVTYEYKITSAITFARYGETWTKSGELFTDALGQPTMQWHFH
ncbi:MAG: hypothetical protein LBS82_05355 [Spirochaetaceae bacterium]|nr:hypothetical protein [Spirochaetaceae bacterium]